MRPWPRRRRLSRRFLRPARAHGGFPRNVTQSSSASFFETQPPALEGVKVDGKWVVIYSRYDFGCALEKHTSGDCKGHDHDSALKLAGAAVLYYLRN